MTTPTNLPSSDNFESKAEKRAKMHHAIKFTGDGREMVPIVLKNLLFNILTLSLYRFWGRTNVRRYIWENTRFKGDPFEYTGTGGELFTGFLVVLVAVFLPLAGIIFWAQTMIGRGEVLGSVLFFIIYLFLLWLMPFGLYRAFKYRLSRTRWRGIRGAQEGNGTAYAWKALGYGLLAFLTVGLMYPVLQNALWREESNNRQFGSGKFSYEGGAGPLYGAFFGAVVLFILGWMIFTSVSTAFSARSYMGGGFMNMLSVVAFLFFFLCAAIGLAVYSHKTLTHFFNNSRFEECRIVFSGELGELFGLYVKNAFILVLTLGIAYPIIQMRMVRYVMSNLSLKGELDLAAISQSTEEEPSFGEGLAEGFDMGTI